MKILIAEDNEDSRVLLESSLELSGYEVESAENGAVALKMVTRMPPDLIISDILMPEMDGYALCKAIKSDEKLREIPFIFYTATYTDPSDEKLAMDLGASKFILKPMEIDTFLLEIKDTLEKHKDQKLPDQGQPLKCEHELEKGYSEVLAKKLDQKVRQLEDERNKLEKSEKQYRRLVEALRKNYFFYTLDTKGIFQYVSPSITNVLGYTQEEFHCHYSEFLTDNILNKDAERYTNLSIKGIQQPTYVVEISHKNGGTHQLEVTEEPIFDKHGQIVAVEGIAHDITKRIFSEKQLAKAQESLQQSQKMEAIGTLAGGIAHDFNNILTPIVGYTEMVLLGFSEDSIESQNLQEVLTAASRAKKLVQQILTFSRHDEQEKKPILLQALVKEALKLLRSSIPKTIEFKENIDTNCNAILANPTQVHQVLMNLCTNAYYAMREQGGILAVSLTEIDISPDNFVVNLDLPPGKYLRLEVSDTGTGIEKKKLERIFEPYFTTKPKDQGTGLGLSVVHGIINSHNGHIAVYSELGTGTTFHAYFPAILKKQPVSEQSHAAEKIIGGNEKILLIDDDEVIGKLGKTLLKSLGYQVTLLNSSVIALDVFRKAPLEIDVVITDMTMPNMTGAELSHEVLKIRPDTPIILCTGYSELLDKDKALAIGIKEYLMKPVSRRDLAKAVRNVLE